MKLEDVILRDTRANQPAANTVAAGTLYYVTDEEVTERSSGSAWESYSDADTGITELTGNITAGPGSGSQVATIADEAVTYAKMQHATESRLLGRGQGSGAGDVQEITLGDGLELSGTTLNASAPGETYALVTVANIENVLLDVFSGNFDIAAGDTIRIEIFGDIFNNTGGARTFSVAVAIGAEVIEMTGAGNVSNATISVVQALAYIQVKTAAIMRMQLAGRISPANPDVTPVTDVPRSVWGFSTSDFTGTQTIKIQVKASVAGASSTFTAGYRILHLKA